jgi:hypothetical protein
MKKVAQSLPCAGSMTLDVFVIKSVSPAHFEHVHEICAK